MIRLTSFANTSSQRKVQSARPSVNMQAKELVGTESLYQLTQIVVEWLEVYNVPPNQSIYDDFMKTQQTKRDIMMKDRTINTV